MDKKNVSFVRGGGGTIGRGNHRDHLGRNDRDRGGAPHQPLRTPTPPTPLDATLTLTLARTVGIVTNGVIHSQTLTLVSFALMSICCLWWLIERSVTVRIRSCWVGRFEAEWRFRVVFFIVTDIVTVVTDLRGGVLRIELRIELRG